MRLFGRWGIKGAAPVICPFSAAFELHNRLTRTRLGASPVHAGFLGFGLPSFPNILGGLGGAVPSNLAVFRDADPILAWVTDPECIARSCVILLL